MVWFGTFVYSVLGGVCIALGGTAFLSLDNKVLGALFFAVGLFTICTFGLYLFTGKVCYAVEQGREYAMRIPVIWLGNLCGTWLVAQGMRLTRMGPMLADKAAALCRVKLDDSLLSLLILGVLCNIMIYIAVEGYLKNPHEVGKYLALLLGVMVFILCGFEHSIADMFYFSMAGLWSGRALLAIAVISVGNAAGGILIHQARAWKPN